jgi:hypothetical protein
MLTIIIAVLVTAIVAGGIGYFAGVNNAPATKREEAALKKAATGIKL